MPAATWSRTQYLEERARELEQLEREARADEWRLLAQTLFGCVLCSALGLAMVFWSVHTTSEIAGVAFWGGLLVGDVGMCSLLLRHYQRTEGAGR